MSFYKYLEQVNAHAIHKIIIMEKVSKSVTLVFLFFRGDVTSVDIVYIKMYIMYIIEGKKKITFYSFIATKNLDNSLSEDFVNFHNRSDIDEQIKCLFA